MTTRTPSWTRTLGLAVLLVVLSTAAYWFEFKKKPEGERKAEQQKKIFQLTDSQISEIRLFQGISYVQLSCLDLPSKTCLAGSHSRWEVKSPAKLKADDGNVHSLLSSLNNLIPGDSLDLQGDSNEERNRLLTQYGLSEEQRKSAQRVEVLFENQTLAGLVLGDIHPMGEYQFALLTQGTKDQSQAQEGKIYLLSKNFREAISKPLTYWRDKKILTIQAHEIASIRYQAGKSRFEAHKENGNWSLSEGISTGKLPGVPGDIENIDNWAAALAYLTAQDFVADQKNSIDGRNMLRGAKALVKLEITKSGEQPVVLELFEKKAKDSQKLLMTASNLDPIFQLEPGSRPRLEKSIADLRLSRLLGSMDRFNTQEVVLRSKSLGDSEMIFEKKDDQWAQKSGKTAEDKTKIPKLLENLSGNRVRAFLPERTPGKETQTLEITLKGEQSNVLRRLQFWKEGAKLLGRDLLSERKETLELDPSLSSLLPWEKL